MLEAVGSIREARFRMEEVALLASRAVWHSLASPSRCFAEDGFFMG